MIGTKKIPQRIAMYAIGLFFIAFGVSLSINSNLGTTPVSSLPYVLSLITDANMSVTVPIIYGIFMGLQMLLLRKKYKWINLTQIIFSTILGYFVDFTDILLGDFMIPTYFGKLLMMAISIMLLAIGISIYIGTKLVSMPADGLALAISQANEKLPFYKTKILVDFSSVVIATILSFIFLGELQGVREGTIIASILVGRCIPFAQKLTTPIVNKFCQTENSKN